jgi:hypothetical protein
MAANGITDIHDDGDGTGVPREYIGPQLPINWVEELESRANKHKTPAVSMSTAVGRDEIIIPKKGEIRVRKFVEPVRYQEDELGPGYYDPEIGYRIGDIGYINGTGITGTGGGTGTVGVAPFSRMLSRADAVGPYGERPEAAKDEIADLLEEEGYRSEMLDVDYGEAKDQNPKSRLKTFKLYREVSRC